MTQEKQTKAVVFRNRLASTVVLWIVVSLPAFLYPHPPWSYCFLGLILLLSFTGLGEFYGITSRVLKTDVYGKLGQLGGVALIGCSFYYLTRYWEGNAAHSRINDFETAILVTFVLILCLRGLADKSTEGRLMRMAATLLGIVYVPWLLNFVQKIAFFTGVTGLIYVFYFILVTKFSDMGAYAVGSLIGKHKLIPRLSPGKTYEGLLGAVLFSVSGSVIFYYCAKAQMPEMSLVHAVILGVAFSLTAVVGDLIESCFKRESGLKDSGKYFPGIGGILDLLDSILFNAPLMYLYLRYILT